MDLNLEFDKMDPEQARQEVKKHLQRFKTLEEDVKYEGDN